MFLLLQIIAKLVWGRLETSGLILFCLTSDNPSQLMVHGFFSNIQQEKPLLSRTKKIMYTLLRGEAQEAGSKHK
jgi:hypothetical protein